MKKTNQSQILKKDTLLLERAKSVLTHQLIGGVGLLVMGLMVFNTLNMVQAANTGASELNLTISAGDLAIDSVGATVVFAATVAGTANSVYQNLNGVAVRDFRDVANYEWDLFMYSAPMTGQTDSNYAIPNTAIKVWPGNATIYNNQTFDNTDVGAGENNTALSSDFKIFNSVYAGQGIVAFNSVGLRAETQATDINQVYAGDATLTVIAS